jgi:transposase-like protein
MLTPDISKVLIRHSAEFKTRAVMACRQAGASIAGIALANGVNANLVHRWIRERRNGVVWADRDGGKFAFCSDEFKRAVVAQCQQPGVSITGVAYSHGLRPARVHKWIKAAKRKPPIPALTVPPADDWLPVVVSGENAPQEEKAGSELRSSPVCSVEANAIDIEFSGAPIRIPMGGENFLGALRVILEHLK